MSALPSNDPNARRPADGYNPMVEILGEQYFLTQPPNQGLNVVVRGMDGIDVAFAMSAIEFEKIKGAVERHPGLALMSAKRYKPGNLNP